MRLGYIAAAMGRDYRANFDEFMAEAENYKKARNPMLIRAEDASIWSKESLTSTRKTMAEVEEREKQLIDKLQIRLLEPANANLCEEEKLIARDIREGLQSVYKEEIGQFQESKQAS